jgi:hypothetical protein
MWKKVSTGIVDKQVVTCSGGGFDDLIIVE